MKPFLAIGAALAIMSSVHADAQAASLRKATPCCWESLFRQGSIGCDHPGRTRGTVLYADEANHPRVKARMQGVVWKGKTFHDDGTFTNRWLGGIQAGSAGVCEEPSWLDGQPCL